MYILNSELLVGVANTYSLSYSVHIIVIHASIFDTAVWIEALENA